MKSHSTLAALAALASTTYAATVTLQETPCLQPTDLKTYTVEVGKLVVLDIPSICGMKLVSTSDSASAPLEAITCQLFKDAAGQQPGSAKFSLKSPALIATNPVQEGSIKCDVGGDPPAASSSSTSSVPSTTGNGLQTRTTTGEPNGVSTLLSIVTATGTGVPVGGGNGYGNGTGILNPTATPKASQKPAPDSGAGRLGLGLGALMLAVGALVV